MHNVLIVVLLFRHFHRWCIQSLHCKQQLFPLLYFSSQTTLCPFPLLTSSPLSNPLLSPPRLFSSPFLSTLPFCPLPSSSFNLLLFLLCSFLLLRLGLQPWELLVGGGGKGRSRIERERLLISGEGAAFVRRLAVRVCEQ